MIETVVILAISLVTLVYTASYCAYEYGEGNKKGAFAVSALCLAIVFFAVNTIV